MADDNLEQLAADVALERAPDPAQQLAELEDEQRQLPRLISSAVAGGDFECVTALRRRAAELPAEIATARLRVAFAERDAITGKLAERESALDADRAVAQAQYAASNSEAKRILAAAREEARPHELAAEAAGAKCLAVRDALANLEAHKRFVEETQLRPIADRISALMAQLASTAPTPTPSAPGAVPTPPPRDPYAQAAALVSSTARYPEGDRGRPSTTGFGPASRPNVVIHRGPLDQRDDDDASRPYRLDE